MCRSEVQAQSRGGVFGGACLDPLLSRLDRAPDLAPQILLPTDRAAGSELIRRAVISDIDIVGAAAHSGAGERSRGAHGGKQPRTHAFERGLGLEVLRLCLRDA